jgi:transcriptional regulator with XRE-family HTH domain
MSDYAVKITIKNGRILSRMRARGIESLAELARQSGIGYQMLTQIVSLKRRPVGVRGEWAAGLENVAGVLQCDVDDLFSDAQREMALERNSGEVYMDEPEVMALTTGDPERAYWIKNEAQRLLDAMPDGRHKSVVMRHMDGETIDEIACDMGISRSRVAQIEQQAMLRMKLRAIRLRSWGFEDGAFSE